MTDVNASALGDQLAVKLRPTIAEKWCEVREPFAASHREVAIHGHRHLRGLACPRHHVAVRIDRLAASGERHRAGRTRLGAGAVGGHRVQPVLERAHAHGFLRIGEHQVGRMRDDISTEQRQHAGSLGKTPVEADQHADLRGSDFVYRKRQVAGREPARLVLEQVQLPVHRLHALRPDQERAVVDAPARRFRKAGDVVPALAPGVLEGKVKPDYAQAVEISTTAAQKELVSLALLGIVTPIVVGIFLHVEALGGFLAGIIVSGQLLAVFLNNSGGAWDNAKKLIEDEPKDPKNNLGKGSERHKAGVVGDTVGDPFKDTAGPALNPMIKVVNLVAVIIAPIVVQYQSATGTTLYIVWAMNGARWQWLMG